MRRYHSTRKTMIAGVVVCLAAASVQGQESDDEGGLQANVGLHFDFNDNIFDNSNQKIESWIARISPELSLSSAPGKRRFSAEYEGEYGKFFDSPDDDFADHSLIGRGLFQTGVRGLLDVSASVKRGHDGRGRGQTEGIPPDSPAFPTEPDVFETIDWTAQYTHGAEGARGRINFGFGQMAREFTTNRDRTQFFDRNENNAFASISIGSMKKTAYVMELNYTSFAYDVDRPGQPSLNGDYWRGLIGITWEATSITEGSVRVGAQRRGFDEPGRESRNRASWDAFIRWSPREYSYFDFSTTRANDETVGPVGQSDYIDRSSYSISWNHEWPIGIESILSWDRRDEDYVATIREQEETETYLGFLLPRGQRFVWEAGISWRSRSSTIPELEYDGMLVTIGVNMQLLQ